MERAVIDRIEDGRTAVLLVGDEERVIDVPLEQLPAGAGKGTWLRVEIDDGELVQCEVDNVETAERRSRVHEKLERVRRKP